MRLCVRLNLNLRSVGDVLSSAVWCVLCCFVFVCGLFKRVCVRVCGLLCDIVWCVVCGV